MSLLSNGANVTLSNAVLVVRIHTTECYLLVLLKTAIL
jgi:hypothetical protein